MKPLIDWFSISFKTLKNLDCFFKWFHLDISEFKPVAGHWNYRYGLWQNGVVIYYTITQDSTGKEYYDICLNLSGSGCRRYESIRGNNFDWLIFYESILKTFGNQCINVSRVDLALDVKDNTVPDMLKIIKLIDEHKYITQFRRVVTGRGSEEWAYFGSPKSDTRLRIYNKAIERGFKDEKWIRFEYQFRNEAADRFLNHYVHCRNVGQCFKDFVSKSVTFTTKPNMPTGKDSFNHHTDRLNPVRWWVEFVKGAGEITKLEVVGEEYNYTALKKYIELQAAPSLLTFVKANGNSLSALWEIIQKQEDRLNEKQKQVIRERQKCLD